MERRALAVLVPMPTFPSDVMRSRSRPAVARPKFFAVGLYNPVSVSPTNEKAGDEAMLELQYNRGPALELIDSKVLEVKVQRSTPNIATDISLRPFLYRPTLGSDENVRAGDAAVPFARMTCEAVVVAKVVVPEKVLRPVQVLAVEKSKPIAPVPELKVIGEEPEKRPRIYEGVRAVVEA